LQVKPQLPVAEQVAVLLSGSGQTVQVPPLGPHEVGRVLSRQAVPAAFLQNPALQVKPQVPVLLHVAAPPVGAGRSGFVARRADLFC